MYLPAACVVVWSPFDVAAATGAGAMFVTTCPPVGTTAETVPDGARVMGMLTGDLVGIMDL